MKQAKTKFSHAGCIFQLVRLQEENDSLVNKHSKNAQQMQNEDINLPNNLEVISNIAIH